MSCAEGGNRQASDLHSNLKALFSRAVTIDLGKILSQHQVSGLVLDVAAGGSGTGPKILGEGTVALDVSTEEIGEAIRGGAKARWVCADGVTMPFRDNVFDHVMTFFGLLYIRGTDKKRAVLRESLRVLRGGGKLVLVEPTVNRDVGDYLVKVKVLNHGQPVHTASYGVSGRGIGQTPTLISDFAKRVGASLKQLEAERYFVAALTKPA